MIKNVCPDFEKYSLVWGVSAQWLYLNQISAISLLTNELKEAQLGLFTEEQFCLRKVQVNDIGCLKALY